MNLDFKGPGYPLLLAGAGLLGAGDEWLAARLLNWAAAVLGAWFAYRMARRFLDAPAALFVMLGLFLNPVWLAAAIEAGTDMPAFGMAMAATWLALSGRRPLHWLGAGLLAACALLTRYNAAFLPLAAAVAIVAAPRTAAPAGAAPLGAAPARWGRAALYAIGFALPLAVWAAVSRAALGALPRNLNYLNVAYELYGGGMIWERYWEPAARRFHSLADVLAFDPGRALRTLGLNVALRWWRDVRVLTPVWIGLPAVAGMVLVWPRRRNVLPIATHFLLAYLVLASVFYTPRFFIYLIPFYLTGAAALIFHAPLFWRPASLHDAGAGPAGTPTRRPRRAAVARFHALRASPPRATPVRSRRAAAAVWLVAVALLMASGVRSAVQLRSQFADAPEETRLAGLELRHSGTPGARIFARKPHVAFFAGMEHVPLPDAPTFLGLLQAARAGHVDYLFFSSIEAQLRHQFLVLADSGIALPGMLQIGGRQLSSGHFYALYRFTGEPVDARRLDNVVCERVLAFAGRHPEVAAIQSYAGASLIDHARPREALAYLERACLRDPADEEAVGLEAWAYWMVGERDSAGRACERLLAMGHGAPAPYHLLLGTVRTMQGRLTEARGAFERATELDPMDPAGFLSLGIAQLALADGAAGEEALDRCVALEARMDGIRRAVLADFSGGGGHEWSFALLQRVPMTALHHSDLSRIAG